MVELYNQMNTIPDKEIIQSGWKSAGIIDAFHNRMDGLESLNPFHDIDPMMEQSQEHDTLRELCNLTVNQLSIVYSREDEDDDDEFHWEAEGNGDGFERNAFAAFNEGHLIACTKSFSLTKKSFFPALKYFLVAKMNWFAISYPLNCF